MGGVMQWLRENVLPKLRVWGRGFVPFVQRVREKVAQGMDWVADPILLVGFLFFVWLAYNTYSGMEALPKDEAARTLEWLKFYAYVVGGIVLIWQVRISNRRATALERTAALGEKGNITERFKNAIEHLGSDSESIRMGGIYGLYHVARESREYVDTVLKILCAHAKSIMAKPGYIEKEKPSNEIAAILDVLFPITSNGNQNVEILFEKVDISGWHLQRGNFYHRNMEHINGQKINLFRANLSNASLSRVILVEVNLSRANMSKTNLSRAILLYANLSGAHLECANLSKAGLMAANLSKATLTNADLSEAGLAMADLSAADFWGANLWGAHLWGANLLGAKITVEQLLKVKTLHKSKLDDHIREEILRHKPELLDPPTEKK